MSTPTRRTPDWLLERIALGELPESELAAARAGLAQEPDGPERLAQLEADNSRTLAVLPAQEVAREVARRRRVVLAGRPERRRLPTLALGLPLAAALSLLVVLSVREPTGTQPSGLTEQETTRIKGDARLVVFRRGQGEPERLRSGAQARAGDLLQLGYVAGGKAYGAVLSLDGRGAVTLHFPEREDGALALDRQGSAPLHHAYELDDAPAFERFVLVTSEQPFDLRAVLEAARTLARNPEQARALPLPLPAGLEQSSFTVEKSSR
jgi:hypothetical protein